MHQQPTEEKKSEEIEFSNTPLNFSVPKLSDPVKNEVPRPDGDPFEFCLVSMLEKDTVQCNAWKDEVQNILIFAGLFSAVVTAFIVESYQRLRPDPNDAIVGLLAHIAQRLDGVSANDTDSVSSLVASTNFDPSRSDISINIFWFISLILSLAAALIGIITLQWLREHQRYDNSLSPKQRIAVLNARLHSLERWYVPEIFAGLPLLLQAALVLFFVGMFEFLFALRLEVAIPVTVSISIPLIFLAVTTLLPTLQICVLQDPYGLSVNNEVPSPCPYKSPQSLISRRLSTASRSIFKCLAYAVAFIYQCFATAGCSLRALTGRPLPTLRAQRNRLQSRLVHEFPQIIGGIRNVSGDWTSIDLSWLTVRTTYATSLSLQSTRGSGDIKPTRKKFLNLQPAFVQMRLFSRQYSTLRPEIYDCTRAVMKIATGQSLSSANGDALYHCVRDLCLDPIDNLSDLPPSQDVTDLCVAFGQYLLYSDRRLQNLSEHRTPVDAAFIEDVLDHTPPGGPSEARSADVLRAAYLDTWVRPTRFHLGLRSRALANLWKQHEEVATRLILNRLQISPQRLFRMRQSEAWIVNWNWFGSKHGGWNGQGFSRPVTAAFRTFLADCSIMRPGSSEGLNPIFPSEANYGGVKSCMFLLTCAQDTGDIADTIQHFTNLLESTPRVVQDKPFLLLAGCFYVDALGQRGHSEKPNDKFGTLLQLICTITGVKESKCGEHVGWEGLDEAVNAVYKYHNSTEQCGSSTRQQPQKSLSPEAADNV